MSYEPIWMVLSDFPSKENELKDEIWLLKHNFRPYGPSLETWYGFQEQGCPGGPEWRVDIFRKADGWKAQFTNTDKVLACSEVCETPEEALCGLYGKCVKEDS